jgi:hypothetical protein
MTAIGFLLIIFGFILKKLDDDLCLPDWLKVITISSFLIGFNMLLSSIVLFLWRVAP